MDAPLRRIVINGSSGSGKSTLARELSARCNALCIEADSLFWESNWREAPPEDFRSRVQAAVGEPSWIFDGNYSAVRSLVWGRADLVIWLDFSLLLCLRRVAVRSARRAAGRQELWNGNRESWRRVLSRDSIVLYTLRTHARRRREMPSLLREFELQRGGQVLVATSPRGLRRGLGRLRLV